ncbi:MAG: hypothetical protein SGI92_11365 [Bryobacteraceae bacterium]|nr:hypothetical protein [Bryobacteraceae bacterium]
MLFRLLVATLLLTSAVLAERDFLTAAEVDQIRLIQEPNQRIQLYLSYAKLRVTQISQAVAQTKPGGSKFIHDLLEDYTKIIEAIDTVSDDALRRKVEIVAATKAIADTNKELASGLEKVRASAPKDLARYQFALDQAIDATRDSAELASEDLSKRSAEAISRAERELKERQASMKPEEVEAKQQVAKKEEDTKRKAPTLRRKGEVVKEQK